MDNVQQDPNPKTRKQVGWCEYQVDFKGTTCAKDAYYTIDFNCDDMTADVCNKHHNAMLALVGLPDEEE